jgi:uncharacterized membrane protein
MKWLFSIHWALIASMWYFGNGLYNIAGAVQKIGLKIRDMSSGLTAESFLLILSGAVVFVCYLMLLNKIQCGGIISIIISTILVLYCMFNLPSVHAFITTVISVFLIAASIKAVRSFPNIYDIMQNYK